MVTKLKKSTETSKATDVKVKIGKTTSSKKSGAALADSVKDSAQQIWQAGLGAFTKAQTEGTKAFEALVKEGISFQRKTQSAAEEKITEATQKMTSMATDISSKASGQWDKLENIFEDRVAKALNKLGVPSAKDINALIARIDELNASVQQLTPAKPAAKPVAKKAASKVAATPVVEAPVVANPAAATKKPAAKKAAPRKPAATPAVATEENPV
jgi:poly(hydroxyalkanoate) granule-associated protein